MQPTMVLGRLQTDFSCQARLQQHPLKASVQFSLLQILLQILYRRFCTPDYLESSVRPCIVTL
jgi:hypothetical protein